MQKYLLNKDITVGELFAEGFYYDDFVLTGFYPVLFYQSGKTRTPTAWLRVRIDLDNESFDTLVMCTHDMIDSTYYTDFGNTEKYKLKIYRNMRKVMNHLCNKEILIRSKQ